MEEKKKHLLELVDGLNFPITSEVLEDELKEMDENELDALIQTYEDISSYEDSKDEEARLTNPGGYKKARQKYNSDVRDAKLETLEELEKEEKPLLQKMDRIDSRADRKVDSVVRSSKKDLEELVSIAEDISLGFKPIQ